MRTYTDWKDAHAYAVDLARSLKREVGILKAKEFNRTVFQVMHLPDARNRYGIELRCELVRPTDPK